MEAAGGSYFVTAVVGSLDDWFRPEMTDESWSELFANLDRVEAICRAHGLTQVVHPHVDTLIETADEFDRFLARSGVQVLLRHRPPHDRRDRRRARSPASRSTGSASSTSRMSTATSPPGCGPASWA